VTKAPEDYGFCPVCGGLFKLDGRSLPDHIAVGRGVAVCSGSGRQPLEEGVVSP